MFQVMRRGFAIVLLVVLSLARAAVARADEQRAWVRAIPDRTTWDRYSKRVGSDELGKFIIDVKTDDIYFIDVNLFNIHADFVLGVLLKQPWTAENIREYNKNYERVKPRFILGYLAHHLKIDKWTYSFWEGDKIDAPTIVRVRKRIAKPFFVQDLSYRPDSPAQEKQAKDVAKAGIPVLTNDQIYQSASYQAFNKGTAVGRFKVVPAGTPYESLTFDRGDIVLLQESYPDITVVAGILSTTFSTPLSHVNLRAGAWRIPNAGNKKARELYGALDGKVVYYEVTDTAMTLREATAAEIEAFKNRMAARRHVDLPPADLKNRRFAMLDRMRAADVVVYGTKAANLGEIVCAKVGVNVPMGFGIPFYWFDQHIKRNGLDKKVDAMLADARWAKDAAWRKSALEELRAAIKAAPIDPALLDALYKRVRVKLGGKGVFVRSSTNSEDLPGFNGAGLYDTVPNVVGKANLGEAVKAVWASVWTSRAVEEREAFGIDHKQVYAGVLVQIGVNATAAGVLVTSNLFDATDENGFTINAKFGLGMKVVDGVKVPEQIVFDADNDGTKIISRSDDATMLVFDDKGGIKEVPAPAGQVILTEERAKRLVQQVQKLMPLFQKVLPLDCEWVLEGETMWIVQARPYVGPH
jgi:Pyruvate phosphate dikinase, AMP/ATP-binding domain